MLFYHYTTFVRSSQDLKEGKQHFTYGIETFTVLNTHLTPVKKKTNKFDVPPWCNQYKVRADNSLIYNMIYSFI